MQRVGSAFFLEPPVVHRFAQNGEHYARRKRNNNAPDGMPVRPPQAPNHERRGSVNACEGDVKNARGQARHREGKAEQRDHEAADETVE